MNMKAGIGLLVAIWVIGMGHFPESAGAADMGTAFTYQGTLENGSGPVTDTCDIRFGLWRDPVSVLPADHVGANQTLPSVSVSAGLFTVSVNFGDGAIDGAARWLEIEMRCTGDIDFVLLAPRVELTAVPHALALPGVFPDTTTGNLGVGTIDPQHELDVRSSATNTSAQILAANSNADTWVMLSSGFNNGGNDPAVIWSDDLVGDDLRFLTTSVAGNGTEHMRIKGTGDVGIGTAFPMFDLEVQTDTELFDPEGGCQGDYASFGVVTNCVASNGVFPTRWIYLDTQGPEINFSQRLDFVREDSLGAGGSPVMSITSTGIGIGTGGPQTPLHVIGQATFILESGGGIGELAITTPNGVPGLSVIAENGNRRDIRFTDSGISLLTAATNAGPAVSNGLIIDEAGNVGIGDTTPDVALDVVGDINYTGIIADVSDQRLKENIAPLSGALAKIAQLRGVYFNMKDTPHRRDVGLIAQEVQEVLPEAVRVIDPDHGYLGVSYPNVVPLIVEAVKEMQTQQSREVRELKSQVADYEQVKARLARLEAMLNAGPTPTGERP